MRGLKHAYLSLPPFARRLLLPLRFLFSLTGRHEVFVLSGPGRAGGKPLCIVCAGTSDLGSFLLKRAFGEGASQRSLGMVPAWRGASWLARRVPEADLAVLHVRPAFEWLPRRGVIARLPAWVRTQADMQAADCVSRGKGKFARIGNSIRRAGLSLELSKIEADFVEFYEQIHLPHVVARHGDSASVQSLEETLAGLRCEGWELLKIMRAGEFVGGGTIEFGATSTSRFRQIGVRGGDPALLEAGVADAVYYHALALSRERGYRTIHLGHSRPFVRDGVLDYKRLLGGYVAAGRYERGGSLDLSIRRMTPGLEDFLADNPLIALDDDGLYRLYGFVRGSEAEGRAQARVWRDRYGFKGTLGQRIFALGGDAPRETDY